MTDAITREEKLMEAIANGSVSNIKPITRQEMFLAKAGGQDVEVPKPITRREKLLQGIIDNGSGGSGDTGGGTETLDALIDGSITEITSNASVIKTNTFYSRNKLLSVNFPYATYISDGSFYGCNKLTEVNLPVATTIDNYAFNECVSLKKIILPLATKIYSAFSSCRALVMVDLPSVTQFLSSVFDSCHRLTTLILRNETLCNLASTAAFNKCYHLLGTVNSIYNPNGDKDCYIYVPRALVDSYKAATNWSTYAAQFRALEDYTVDGTITGELDESKI